MAHPPGDEADQHWSRVLLDALEEGFTLQGRHGEILATNPAAGQILGLSPDQLWGRTSLDPRWHAVHDDGSDFPGVEHPAMVTLATGRPVSGQVMGVHRPDGSQVWIKISSRPLGTGPGGLPTGVVTSFTDITAERAAEAAMTRHRQRLEAVVASLPVGVMVVTAAEQISVVNVEFCRMFGLRQDPRSLRGAPVGPVLWSLAPLLGDVDTILNRIQARATQQLPVRASEVVLTDGRVVEVDLHAMSLDPQADAQDDPQAGAEGLVAAVARKELVIVCHDVTARIETSRALAAARDAAEAASRLKSDFLSTLSHEVRTPISGIVGMVEVLLTLPLDEDVLEVVEGVRNSAEALAVQLEDLLDLARIEAGRLELRPAPFDLRDLAERSVQVFGRQARDKHLVLVAGVAGDVPDLVVGDLNRVRQVLLNLVGNAVKFTDAGQVVLDVTTSAADEVTLTVSDTGPGLPEDAREQLFSPFVQVDPSTDRRHGGFGLGLAICSRLVALMGGRIRVESPPGQGARFVVVLPMPAAPPSVDAPPRAVLGGHRVRLEAAPSAAADVLRRSLVDVGATLVDPGHEAQSVVLLDEPAAGEPSHLRVHPELRPLERLVVLSSTNEPGAPSGALPADGPVVLALPVTMARLTRALLGDRGPRPVSVEPFDGGRVLLAEDNEVNALLLGRMLGLLGLTCDTVTDGTDALELLRRHHYDVVLMDVHMPRLDGIAATRTLRAHEGARHTPVLALTASAAAEEEQRCREAGMDGFVTKPVGIAQLRAALAPYVGRPAAAPQGPPLLDPARLDDLADQLGDVELVRETVAAYLEELGPRTRAIEDAVASGDRDAFRLLTHSLKSSSAMLGAVAMAQHCAAAEAVALTAGAEQLGALRDAGAGLAAPTARALAEWAAGG